jgi:hypothetical protein
MELPTHRRLQCDMDPREEWNRWLAEADSVLALAPETYDHDAARVRARALGQRLIRALPDFEVRIGSDELYQDSTGLAGHRISAKGDRGPFAPTFAWVLQSHFGVLATVADCQDPDLLSRIRSVLGDAGLKYIPHEYVANTTYQGLCKSLVGFSLKNRYFELCVEFNYEELGRPSGPSD